jgi:5'-deoxynucleotidase YfbR-like HD superfamily hydrolase
VSTFEQRLVDLFAEIHPLDQIARAGFVLRGVASPESVAAHSHFVSLMTLLICDEHPDLFDRDRAVAMALIHDLCESRLMDIPMPTGDAHLSEVKDQAEQAITEELFKDLSPRYGELHQELIDLETPEAKLVRGIDKAQMMIKILCYDREGRGRLSEFWESPKNFPDYGLAPLKSLFEAICTAAGRRRPAD